MIISYKHNFVFMRTRKTASTSMQAALAPFCGPRDIVSGTVGSFNQNDTVIRRPHPTIRRVRWFLKKDWGRMFKFAFVRNPWDLVVSYYFWIRKCKGQTFGREDFDEWVRAFPRERRKKFLKNRQHLYTCLWRDRIALDFVGRFENLADDFDYVCKRIGVPTPSLGRHKAEYRDFTGYRHYYDEQSRRIIEQIFRKDIRLFGYEF